MHEHITHTYQWKDATDVSGWNVSIHTQLIFFCRAVNNLFAPLQGQMFSRERQLHKDCMAHYVILRVGD